MRCSKGHTSNLPLSVFGASGTEANKIGSKKGSRRDLVSDVLKGKPPACLSVCSGPEGGGKQNRNQERKAEKSCFGCFKGETSCLPLSVFMARGTAANKMGSTKGRRRNLAPHPAKGKPSTCISVCILLPFILFTAKWRALAEQMFTAKMEGPGKKGRWTNLASHLVKGKSSTCLSLCLRENGRARGKKWGARKAGGEILFRT